MLQKNVLRHVSKASHGLLQDGFRCVCHSSWKALRQPGGFSRCTQWLLLQRVPSFSPPVSVPQAPRWHYLKGSWEILLTSWCLSHHASRRSPSLCLRDAPDTFISPGVTASFPAFLCLHCPQFLGDQHHRSRKGNCFRCISVFVSVFQRNGPYEI